MGAAACAGHPLAHNKMPRNNNRVEAEGKFIFPSRCGLGCIIIRIPVNRRIKSLEGLQNQACINNSTIISMDNKEKGYNLRVLFITLGPARPKSNSVPPVGLAALPRMLAAWQDTAVSVAALRPMLGWSSKTHAVADDTKANSAQGDHANLATYIMRWPVLERHGGPQGNKLWPGAAFAFPFVVERLVNILHAQPFDIMIAVDTQFTGYVAYRLREITGVPYVIVQGTSVELTPKRQSTTREAILTALACDAEFVLGPSSNAEAFMLRFPGSRFRDFDAMNSTGDKFIVLLQEAVRQSRESFDW